MNWTDIANAPIDELARTVAKTMAQPIELTRQQALALFLLSVTWSADPEIVALKTAIGRMETALDDPRLRNLETMALRR